MKNKSKTIIIVVCIVLVLLLLGGFIVSNYNSLVSLKTDVETSQANIETQLQRRSDLIPNLVNTVKGYASHETEAIKNVSDARAKLAGAGTLDEKIKADGELSSALSRLLMITENYPNLKADKQYAQLMDELAGTENRITVARNDYNKVASTYNKTIKSFPKVIFANIFGYEQMPLFKAAEGAQTPPKVDFSK